MSRYPDALNHPEIFRGHWAADYHSIGRLVGGKDAQDEGVGVTVLWADILFLMVYAALVFSLASRKMRQKMA